MLGLYFILLIWDILLHTDFAFVTDYCKFDKNHSLCGGGGIHPRCGGKGDYIYKDLSDVEISAALHTHNNYRNELALGKLVGGHGELFPKAANMEEMKWDKEIASIAAGSVKKCLYAHTCLRCRRTGRHKSVGENIFKRSSTESLENIYEGNISVVVSRWFSEVKFYDPADAPKYRFSNNSLGKKSSNYRHFTQIIWWSNLRLGCAKIAFKTKEEKYDDLLVNCLYTPMGNIVGENIYEIGEPCSKCKGFGRTCSKKYKGLCAAQGRPNDPDPPIAYITTFSDSSRVCFQKIVFLLCLSFLRSII